MKVISMALGALVSKIKVEHKHCDTSVVDLIDMLDKGMILVLGMNCLFLEVSI